MTQEFKTLEEVRNSYAYDAGFADWDVLVSYGEDMNHHINATSEIYALQFQEANKELVEAMQEFCTRVENGEVRSKRTYAKFKHLITKHKQDGK